RLALDHHASETILYALLDANSAAVHLRDVRGGGSSRVLQRSIEVGRNRNEIERIARMGVDAIPEAMWYILSHEPMGKDLVDLLLCLLAVSPLAAQQMDQGELPLHFLLRKAHAEANTLLSSLLAYYPAAAQTPNSSGVYPLHVALQMKCDSKLIGE